MTWDEFKNKYNDVPCRGDMTEEQEREFVEDCFGCYEQEGFAKRFCSQDGDYPELHGKLFTVVGRTPIHDGENNGVALECLPMWIIRFEDGTELTAYPNEIIQSEMGNVCPEKYLKPGFVSRLLQSAKSLTMSIHKGEQV